MRSIRGLLIRRVLLPLASLAILLVAYNGYVRYNDATQSLVSGRQFVVDLLRQPSIEAISIGNDEYLLSVMENVAQVGHGTACISLNDVSNVQVSSYGDCPALWPVDNIETLYVIEGSLDALEEIGSEGIELGNLLVVMKTDQLDRQTTTIAVQLALSALSVLVILLVIVRVLRKELVVPVENIASAMMEVGRQNYQVRIDNSASRSELRTLSDDINAAIAKMQVHAVDLDDRRAEAESALAAADAAYIAKEGLIQTMIQEVASPASELKRHLTMLAMERKGEEGGDAIHALSELAKKSDSSIAELIDIVIEGGTSGKLERVSLRELMISLEAEMKILQVAGPRQLQYTTINPVDEAMSERVIFDTDLVKVRRIIHHLRDAMFSFSPSVNVHAVLHVLPGTGDDIELTLELKAIYANTPWQQAERGLSPDLPAEVPMKHRHLVGYLARELGIEIHHAKTGSGTLAVTARLCSNQKKRARARYLGSNERVIVVSNDAALKGLSIRAELSDVNINLVDPRHVTDRYLATLTNVLAIYIDIGKGQGEDFDSQRMMERFKSSEHLQDCLYIAITTNAQISAGALDKLFEYGYKGTLHKPVTLKDIFESVGTLAKGDLYDLGGAWNSGSNDPSE